MRITSLAVALTLGASTLFAHAADLTGAGATFPYPIYAKWASAYKAKTGVGLNYQSIGSGGGIKQIKAKTVNFGASDSPLKPDELQASGLVQFPTVVGGVVAIYNVPGVTTQLKLSGSVLAEIFLGNIKTWNDAAIAKLNPGVALPEQNITVVHRSDGSGTSFLWTNYLSKVSSNWKTNVGEGTAVNWKTGVGGKGNEGVAANVTRIKGAIGYTEYAYAKQNKIAYAQIQNKEGKFINPSEESFIAATKNAEWSKAPGFYLILTDQAGADSYPVTGATFILMHKAQENADTARDVLKFFDWAYSQEGDKLALDLDYIPMPDTAVQAIRNSWKSNIRDEEGKAVWK